MPIIKVSESDDLPMYYFSPIQLLPHHLSHLELHRALGWDMDFLQSLRILCGSGSASSWFKHTEIPELKAVVSPVV